MRQLKVTCGFIAAILAALAIPVPLLGQGCAMCYQSAAASGAQGAQALRNGILILLFPPIFISTAIGFFAYGKRNKFNIETKESEFDKKSS